MTEIKRFSLVKPTLETPFHVDFDWWKQHDNDWRVYLYGYLCQEHQATFSIEQESSIDWIDEKTAEIHVVDGLQHVLMTHCARQSDFISNGSTLVDSAFRIFLANGNSPITPVELADKIGRTPDTILRTLSGDKVYKGIRPCHI